MQPMLRDGDSKVARCTGLPCAEVDVLAPADGADALAELALVELVTAALVPEGLVPEGLAPEALVPDAPALVAPAPPVGVLDERVTVTVRVVAALPHALTASASVRAIVSRSPRDTPAAYLPP